MVYWGAGEEWRMRDGMEPGAAARIICRLATPDLFLLVRHVEGASRQAYVEWLAASLRLLHVGR